MAKAKEAAKAAPVKEKKVRVDKGPKVVQLDLSTNGNSGIKQSVSHVRGSGVHVTTLALNAKGETVGVHTVWIPGLKPKSKKGDRFLVIDKGPKPKKDKAAKKK